MTCMCLNICNNNKGSYGSLSDPLASGKEELTQKAVVNTGASRKKAAPSGASAKEQAKTARAER